MKMKERRVVDNDPQVPAANLPAKISREWFTYLLGRFLVEYEKEKLLPTLRSGRSATVGRLPSVSILSARWKR
jgi:hypothetical protein